MRRLFLMMLLPACIFAAGKKEVAHFHPWPEVQEVLETAGLPAQQLFSEDRITDVLLTFSPEEYRKLLKNFDANAVNEIYVRGSFTFVDQGKKAHYPTVGLRIRGNTFSRVRPELDHEHRAGNTEWQKPHFRVGFDEYLPDTDFYGLKSLNLKMYNTDPSYLRENYAMDLFRRAGVPTYTRILYTRMYIYVQGDPAPAYLGVYRMLEPIDKVFLKDRFPKNQKGFLWKCGWPTPLTPASVEKSSGVEDPDNGKHFAYDLKTRKDEFPAARAQLLDFTKKLTTLKGEEFRLWAEKSVNVELLLRSMAVSNAVGSMDDYWANVNNFYLYFDEAGKVHFIPYDYDNILGTAFGENPISMDPFEAAPLWEPRPLIRTFLGDPLYRRQYAGYLAELIDPARGLLSWETSRDRLSAWQKMIAPYIDNEALPGDSSLDLPPDWGKHPHIRLLNAEDTAEETNFFRGRIQRIRQALAKEGF